MFDVSLAIRLGHSLISLHYRIDDPRISRYWTEYIVRLNMSVVISRGVYILNQVELRKLQMTGGASYTVSLPKNWVKEQGLKVGDVVAVMPRSDSSLTLIPHEKIPAGKNRGAEVTVSPPKEQDREQILRTILAQYLAGYDIIRVRFPATARPDLRTYLREAARKMFVGSEIIEESKDELSAMPLQLRRSSCTEGNFPHEPYRETDAERRGGFFEGAGPGLGRGDHSQR